jgi:hypothetical protein
MLKILHSALSNDATALLRVPFTRAVVGYIADNEHEYIRSISKSELSSKTESQLALDLDITPNDPYWRQLGERSHVPRWRTESNEKIPGQLADGGLQHGYMPISRVSEARTRRVGHQRSVTELIDEASFDRLFASQISDLWLNYSQRALVQIRNAQDRGIARILRSVLTTKDASTPIVRPVEDADEAYRIVNTFFQAQRLGAMLRLSREDFIDNYDRSILIQEVVAEVADVQRGIDHAQEPQHRIEELLGRLYGGRKKVELQGREVVVMAGKDPIPLESLSSGEKQLLQLLLECLTAGRSPVLIDEPELSLHVDWQNELVQCMRLVNENAQLIMATHSPEVMANLEDTTIFEL